MSTRVLTISSRIPNEPYYFYHQFVRSCKAQNIEPTFLPTDSWRGLCSKPKILLSYLEKEGASFESMVFCDAWDIVWADTLDRVMSEFRNFNFPMVFNAERNCFPRSDWAERHFPTDSPFRFLNSGFIVGHTEAVLEMLRGMKAHEIPDDYQDQKGQWHHVNDQEEFMKWYLDHMDKIGLDIHARICQSLHGSETSEFWLEVPGNHIWSSVTKNRPCVFHGNGSGKDWLKRIIQWLGV